MIGNKYKLGQILEESMLFQNKEPNYWEVIEIYNPPKTQIIQEFEVILYGKISKCGDGTVETLTSFTIMFFEELPKG